APAPQAAAPQAAPAPQAAAPQVAPQAAPAPQAAAPQAAAPQAAAPQPAPAPQVQPVPQPAPVAVEAVQREPEEVDVTAVPTITQSLEEAIEEINSGATPQAQAAPQVAPTQESNDPSQRSMTYEERNLFNNFVTGKEDRAQLVDALEKLTLAPYTGNLILTGEEGMDTLGFAKNIVKYVQNSDSNFSGRAATISAQSLNARDVTQILKQVTNGAFIIDKAGMLQEKTVRDILKFIHQEENGVIIIMSDTKLNIKKLMSDYPDLAAAFNANIDMQALTDDMLVECAKKYANEKEYSIDDMGILELHTKINERQTSEHSVTVDEVKQMIDNAIEHANKKTPGNLIGLVLGKRYDNEDMIKLTDKDFV
ncbi:MAG: hypothetical protein K6F84_01980, partial [Lachnospiraceae bacterium]|nr:hypothetical protein [Lachnospiraceae bacterium]